jgi:hypothetical protein
MTPSDKKWVQPKGLLFGYILPLEALRLDPQQQCTDCCQLAHVLPKETVVANVAEAVFSTTRYNNNYYYY